MRSTVRYGSMAFAAGALVFWASPGMADAAAGKKLAQQRCAMCHGLDGLARMPIAPHLAGENEIYLQTQLKAFRSGKRENEMMSVVAKDLTDEQIVDLADWYASIEITVTMPP